MSNKLLILAKEVVKHELEWDDNLAIAISKLKKYLDNQTVNKIRAGLTLHLNLSAKEKGNLSDEYIVVREKYKPFRQIINPNYNPNKKRRN